MKYLFALSLLFTTFAAAAASWPCTIHPPKGTPETGLPVLTKVTKADAQKAALTDFAATASVAGSELEVEHGCLIYSFDVRVAGKPGIDEVIVDAGNGKVLSRKHETPEEEAVEAKQEAAEATAAPKPAQQVPH